MEKSSPFGQAAVDIDRVVLNSIVQGFAVLEIHERLNSNDKSTKDFTSTYDEYGEVPLSFPALVMKGETKPAQVRRDTTTIIRKSIVYCFGFVTEE